MVDEAPNVVLLNEYSNILGKNAYCDKVACVYENWYSCYDSLSLERERLHLMEYLLTIQVPIYKYFF